MAKTYTRPSDAETPPPLASGDHLTRAEFERRYAAATDVHRAELVEGVVYVASPVRFDPHGQATAAVITWLGTFAAHSRGVRCADNTTVRLDADNEVQPDALLLLQPECGGQVRIASDGFLDGAPELIVEVAASTASYDLHEKCNAYRRNGVQEYVVWRTEDREIDWFVLHEGAYQRQRPDADGIFRCRVFPGLWLNHDALLAHDVQQVLATQQTGIASAEFTQWARALPPGSRNLR